MKAIAKIIKDFIRKLLNRTGVNLKKTKDDNEINTTVQEVSGSDATTVESPAPDAALNDKKIIETLLSGSFSKGDHDPKQVDDIMEQILNLSFFEDSLTQTCTPGYILNCPGDTTWLYSLTRNTYMPVKARIEVIPVEKLDEENFYCVIGSDTYKVPADMIKSIGWN